MRAYLGTQVDRWCAVRTPGGRSRSEGMREVCRALEGNVAELQPSQVVLESTEQFQPFLLERWSRPLEHAVPHDLWVVCSSGEKASSCSTHDFDSPMCTSARRSIAWSADLVLRQIHNLRVARATMPLRPGIGIIFSPSCYLDSTGVGRGGQGFVIPYQCCPIISRTVSIVYEDRWCRSCRPFEKTLIKAVFSRKE
jgi:hypothetical protein